MVLAEVPPHCTAVGVPARIVKYHSEEEKPAQNLDQINIPDPYAADLQEIHEEMQNLQQEILQEMRDGLGI